MNWKKIGLGLLAFDLVALNLAGAYMLTRIGNGERLPIPDFERDVTNRDECGEECRRQIKQEAERLVSELESGLATPSGSVSAKPVVTATPAPISKTAAVPGVKPKVRTVQYVTIPGSGQSRSLGWEQVAGTDFYFDKSDYPGLVEVYFEATMNLVNGNGLAYVRLFDAGHGIGVDGSEVNTNSQTAAVAVSGKVNFWEGKNLIRVQIKTLTADTAVYNYGRLKIVSEN